MVSRGSNGSMSIHEWKQQKAEAKRLDRKKDNLDGFYYLSNGILIMSFCAVLIFGYASFKTEQDLGGGVIDWHSVAILCGICLVVIVITGTLSLILNHLRNKCKQERNALRDTSIRW